MRVVAAAVTGGLAVVAALAGLLGDGADLGAHLVRRDPQFEAAVAALRPSADDR